MKLAPKILISGSVIGGGGIATGKTYDIFAPKTVGDGFEGEKIKKVSTTKQARTIFAEHKEEIKKAIEGIEDSTEINSASEKIKNYCEEKFKQLLVRGEWEQIVKFCEFKFKTAKGFLANYDENDFISTDEDYKTSLFFFKNTNNSGKSQVQGSGTLDHGKLKTGCESNLSEKISASKKDLYSGLNNFCKKQKNNTIEKLIKSQKQNGALHSENKGSEIFKAGKHTTVFIDLLKNESGNNDVSNNTSDSDGGTKLQTWCTTKKDEKLTGETTISLISHVRDVCSYVVPQPSP